MSKKKNNTIEIVGAEMSAIENMESTTESIAVDDGERIIKRKTFDRFNTVQFVLTTIIFLFVFASVFSVSIVPSLSMYPTLTEGSLLIGKRNVDNIDYDDIITFYPYNKVSEKFGMFGTIDMKRNGYELYVKRVVGKPGDTISVHDGFLVRNGEVISSNYTAEMLINYDMEELTLGDNFYFVMGDNRNNSNDSHIIGPINISHIYSKVLFHLDPII